MTANERYFRYLDNVKDRKILLRLNNLLDKEIQYGFSNELEFGTAGMRGIMELGTFNMNVLTVCKLAKAVSVYLKQNFEKSSCVVCFDTRLNSKKFSRMFATVLSNEGIDVKLFSSFAPTPLCVFATTKLNATLGVMITASHNKKEYNGIKIYDRFGIQINDEIQKEISEIFKKTDEIEVYNAFFKKKLGKNVKFLGKEFENTFILCDTKKQKNNLKIVYTPLNGTGYFCVKNLLKMNGYKISVPKCQKKGNGYFKTCPYPNPEFVEAFNKAQKLAKRKKADIIIATDPDADRLGVMVKHNGEYVKLSGNEVGYIFADFMLKENKQTEKFVVTSVVTSPLIDKICEYHGAKVVKTLTGFTSLGSLSRDLAKKFGKDSVVLTYEESCGYVVKNSFYDKDGIFASLKICEIANELKKQNKTLVDYLDDIYKRTEYLYSLSDSVVFEGINAKEDMNKKVENLRNNPPKEIFGEKIEKIVDYQKDNTGLKKQNFLYFYAKNIKFIVRPSGTEPKLKIYLFVCGNNLTMAQKEANKVLDEIKNVILK